MLTGRIIDADPEGRTSLTDALDVLMAGRPKPDPDDARSGSTALIAEAAKRGGDLVVRALRTASSASATTQAVGSAAGAVSRSAGAMATQLRDRQEHWPERPVNVAHGRPPPLRWPT